MIFIDLREKVIKCTSKGKFILILDTFNLKINLFTPKTELFISILQINSDKKLSKGARFLKKI